MYLLDTNVVSELYKIGDHKADLNVTAWIAANHADNFYISPVTLFEVELGILLCERRDAAKAKRLRDWMTERIMPEFRQRILSIDATIAFQCAALHVPQTRPDNDAWIAATALAHDMTVVTRNEADFSPMGVRLLNPWQPQTGSPSP